MSFCDTYRGKRILVTGHTGFKGAWLCEWLLGLGAEVTGFALPPPSPSLFHDLDLRSRLQHNEGDVGSLAALQKVMEHVQPDFIFHLAAQSLVRLSYAEPVSTYATNVMGTVNLLESVRLAARPCVVVAITTDKCYENKEWAYGYREEDPVGGYDPYSSSKGAAELVISAYRRSFFSAADSVIQVGAARAGNVVGGGDRALDRIVPDSVRALQRGGNIPVRNKYATRPWQHVLEPLSGYLWLGARLAQTKAGTAPADVALRSSFNFGPALTSNRNVLELVQEILKNWPGNWEDQSDPHAVHEAEFLHLATDKAYHFLGWQPVWDFAQTIAETIKWYRRAAEATSENLTRFTQEQITHYVAAARVKNLTWSL